MFFGYCLTPSQSRAYKPGPPLDLGGQSSLCPLWHYVTLLATIEVSHQRLLCFKLRPPMPAVTDLTAVRAQHSPFLVEAGLPPWPWTPPISENRSWGPSPGALSMRSMASAHVRFLAIPGIDGNSYRKALYLRDFEGKTHP